MSQTATAEAGKPEKQHHRVRSIFSAILIVLACILAPLTIAAVWISDVIGDTDTFVSTMAPLARDPAVQTGITNRVTNEVVSAVDINGIVDDLTAALQPVAADRPRLAGALTSLGPPLENGFAGFVHSTVQKVVQSDQFAKVWDNVMRAAHSTMVQALTGNKGVVKATNDSVVVDLGPLVDQVKGQLVANGFKLASKIPEVHTTYTIADTGSLAKARRGFRLLNTIGDWMPVIVVVLLAGGVVLAAHRRKTLVRAALGLFVSTVILGLALWIFRHFYLHKLPPTVNKDAAASVYDTIIHFLRVSVRTVATLALVFAFAAYFTGPGRFAVFVRTAAKNSVGRLRHAAGRAGFKDGGAAVWVHKLRPWIAWVAVGGAALWYILLSRPSVAAVLWLTFGVLVVLFLLEFLDPSDGAEEGVEPAGTTADPTGS